MQFHVCRPPAGAPLGAAWACPECFSEFVHRLYDKGIPSPLTLWIREYEPPRPQWVPPDRRKRVRT